MSHQAAVNAKSLIEQAQKKDTYSIAGEKSVQGAITTASQYIYKFAVMVGIY
ncbi:MAG: hypothetical protein PHW34_09020 [Hespellia sp.]|nr:hypothetical protein [Hespellia sp.]